MAYLETPTRANVEFLRSSQRKHGRTIRLNHSPAQVPQQLAGRVDPEFWRAFMAEVEVVANEHPYVIKPGAKQVGKWAVCGAIGAVIGICFINPDGGDYGVWSQQVNTLVARWQPPFAARGVHLSFTMRRDAYLQLDVDPNAPVVAAPVPVPAPAKAVPALGAPVPEASKGDKVASV